jgi:UDP-N-acetylmuramate--alanine ligase
MNPKHVFFVGIKGVAMTALALWYRDCKVKVSGCDTEELFPTDEGLKTAGIKVWETADFSSLSDKIAKADLVVYTGAHGGGFNPLVRYAKSLGIACLPHGEALGKVMAGYRQISVAGCHGKTTVSAMISVILSENSRFKPSYAVGCGRICPLGAPGRAGNSGWFIAEADEYATDPESDLTPRFLWHQPEIGVVTNIEFDHPDIYGSLQDVIRQYRNFVNRIGGRGSLVVNGDDIQAKSLPYGGRRIPVGYSTGNTFQIGRYQIVRGKTIFSIISTEDRHPHRYEITLNVPGEHNVRNAALAAAAARQSGADWNQIIKGLEAFCGVRRRLELVKSTSDVIYYDDYAHHPSEISKSLEALRLWNPGRRVICVFQPHTYSRTAALLGDFAASFAGADLVLLTDIYASAREKNCLPTVSLDKLFQKTQKTHPSVHLARTPASVEALLENILTKGDLVVFMGAGDIYFWQQEMIARLSG